VFVSVSRTPVTIAPVESFTVPETLPTGDADKLAAANTLTATKEYSFLELALTLPPKYLCMQVNQQRGRLYCLYLAASIPKTGVGFQRNLT
jgi:hypothetical protein